MLLSKCQNKWQNFSSFASFSENLKFIEKGGATKIIIAWVSDLVWTTLWKKKLYLSFYLFHTKDYLAKVLCINYEILTDWLAKECGLIFYTYDICIMWVINTYMLLYDHKKQFPAYVKNQNDSLDNDFRLTILD